MKLVNTSAAGDPVQTKTALYRKKKAKNVLADKARGFGPGETGVHLVYRYATAACAVRTYTVVVLIRAVQAIYTKE